MMDFVAAFQHWLMLACFVALAVCLFALAVLCAIPNLTDAIRRFCGMDNFGKVVCGVFIVGAVLYGGSKGVNVRWDDGLSDNGTLITNDTVSVRWTYSGIPSASSVFIDYREAGSTNEWLNLAETLASAQEWTGTLANATNYDYWVYSTYVPPVPVHTNGVWVGQAYETKARVGAKSFLILNGKVVADGRTIAPPKWTRPLPYDAEVEYLQSTGTQYIDTGDLFDSSYRYTFIASYPSESYNPSIGARSQNTYYPKTSYLTTQNSCPQFYASVSKWANPKGAFVSIPNNTFHTFDIQVYPTGICTVNGVTFSHGFENVQFKSDYSILLFALNNVGVPVIGQSGLKFKLYQVRDADGVLIRDFIPVRVGTVGYMYDRVSGELFGNIGTGAFTVGPDK